MVREHQETIKSPGSHGEAVAWHRESFQDRTLGVPRWGRRPNKGEEKPMDADQMERRRAARLMRSTAAAGTTGGGRGGAVSAAAAPSPWRSREE